MSPKPVVRHVTPHLNGGLGRVMLSTLRHGRSEPSAFHHEILVTDRKPMSDEVRAVFEPYRDQIRIEPVPERARDWLAQADIVQVEWWNHPLIYRWLMCDDIPEARIVVCCHVSGLSRPNVVARSVVEASDLFLIANKVTRRHPVFSDPGLGAKTRDIVFPIDTERFDGFEKRAHEGFAVGYVGTLDYAKLHPGFLAMSAAADIPDARFVVCGVDHEGRLEREAAAVAPGLFAFTGFVESVKDALAGFDVFGYPLAPGHFGSGEQALIEAMFVGLPVVVFANPPELEIVRADETGLVVETPAEYSRALEFLRANPDVGQRLGEAARADVRGRLSPERCFERIDAVYCEAMARPKRRHDFTGTGERLGETDPAVGAKLLVASLGDDAEPFRTSLSAASERERGGVEAAIADIEPAMKTRSKGSLFHYLFVFPDDPVLNAWAALVHERDGDHEAAAACRAKASARPA